VRWLRGQFGSRASIGEPETDGRLNVVIGFPETHDDPARDLVAYADALEVLEPLEVRSRMAEIGQQLVARHGGGSQFVGGLER
jgi:hypothetical protein